VDDYVNKTVANSGDIFVKVLPILSKSGLNVDVESKYKIFDIYTLSLPIFLRGVKAA
jgi:hypothetical protein